MEKKKYIIPEMFATEFEEHLMDTFDLGSQDTGDAESKRNVIFASFDSYDSDDDWGDIWADETEEY